MYIFYFFNNGGIMRNVTLIFLECAKPTPNNEYHENIKQILKVVSIVFWNKTLHVSHCLFPNWASPQSSVHSSDCKVSVLNWACFCSLRMRDTYTWIEQHSISFFWCCFTFLSFVVVSGLRSWTPLKMWPTRQTASSQCCPPVLMS